MFKTQKLVTSMAGLKNRHLQGGTQMMDFGDTIVGVYHFLTDRAPRDIPLVDPRPCPTNPWLRNGQALVAKVKTGGDIRAAIDRAMRCWVPWSRL